MLINILTILWQSTTSEQVTFFLNYLEIQNHVLQNSEKILKKCSLCTMCKLMYKTVLNFLLNDIVLSILKRWILYPPRYKVSPTICLMLSSYNAIANIIVIPTLMPPQCNVNIERAPLHARDPERVCFNSGNWKIKKAWLIFYVSDIFYCKLYPKTQCEDTLRNCVETLNLSKKMYEMIVKFSYEADAKAHGNLLNKGK